LGAVTMEAFGMDSSGRPLAPGSESSRYARHRLSHAPLSAAAAAGASLGTGLLWPTAASAAPFVHPAAQAD